MTRNRVDEGLFSAKLDELSTYRGGDQRAVLRDLRTQRFDAGDHGKHVLDVVARLEVALAPTAKRFELRRNEVDGGDREDLEVFGQRVRCRVGYGIPIPAIRRPDPRVRRRDDVDADSGVHQSAERPHVDTPFEGVECGDGAADEDHARAFPCERAADRGDGGSCHRAPRAHEASLFDSSSRAIARSRALPMRSVSASARYSCSIGSSAAAIGTLR